MNSQESPMNASKNEDYDFNILSKGVNIVTSPARSDDSPTRKVPFPGESNKPLRQSRPIAKSGRVSSKELQKITEESSKQIPSLRKRNKKIRRRLNNGPKSEKDPELKGNSSVGLGSFKSNKNSKLTFKKLATITNAYNGASRITKSIGKRKLGHKRYEKKIESQLKDTSYFHSISEHSEEEKMDLNSPETLEKNIFGEQNSNKSIMLKSQSSTLEVQSLYKVKANDLAKNLVKFGVIKKKEKKAKRKEKKRAFLKKPSKSPARDPKLSSKKVKSGSRNNELAANTLKPPRVRKKGRSM